MYLAYYLFRLLTYHEGKLADVHSPPVDPTKVAAKKNIITNHYNASNMLQLFLFLRNLLWINTLHLHRESKKTRHLTLAHNFTAYWPIFKILPLFDSEGNL